MRTASRSFTRSFTRSSPSSRSLSSKYCSSESTKPARSSGGPGVPSAAATGAGVAWGACAAGLGKAGRPPLLARRRRRGRRALALTKAVSALLVAWAAVAAGCGCSAAASGKQAASPTCLSCQCCCDSLRARDASARGTRVEGCRGEPPVWRCRLPGACRLCTWRGKVYCSSRNVRFPAKHAQTAGMLERREPVRLSALLFRLRLVQYLLVRRPSLAGRLLPFGRPGLLAHLTKYLQLAFHQRHGYRPPHRGR